MRRKLQEIEPVWLVITSGVVIEGQPARPGTLVELEERDAKDLLRRGKARLATEDEIPEDTGAAGDADAAVDAGADADADADADAGADTDGDADAGSQDGEDTGAAGDEQKPQAGAKKKGGSTSKKSGS